MFLLEVILQICTNDLKLWVKMTPMVLLVLTGQAITAASKK